MKKFLSFLLIMVATVATLGISKIDINAEESTTDGKVVVHYKRLDDVYDEVGVWTFGNGDAGSNNGIAKTEVDDFGAVIEITVDRSNPDSLAEKGEFIPIKAALASNSDTWPGDDNKDSADGANVKYDWSSLIDGTVDEMHVYFIEGNDKVFVNTDDMQFFNNAYDYARFERDTKPTDDANADLGNVTVIYFDPQILANEDAYAEWDIWTWGSTAAGTQAPATFQWDYISPEGYEMKVATINVTDTVSVDDTADGGIKSDNHIGFIVRKPDWSQKQCGSNIYIDVSDVKGSGEKTVYYTAGSCEVAYSYEDFVTQYSQFLKNELVAFDAVQGTGTHAITTEQIQISFLLPAELATLANNIVLKDTDNDQEIGLSNIVAVNADEDKATVFTADVDETLAKDGNYELNFKDGETTVAVDLDNNSPMISYTNKVKLDSSKYDERNDVYLIEKDATFNLEDYIRLNIVDDRDGSLVDQLEQTELPDSSILGNYVLRVSATDSWDNESELLFNFKVYEPATEEDATQEPAVKDEAEEGNFFEDNMALVIGGVAIIIITATAGTMLIRKKY